MGQKMARSEIRYPIFLQVLLLKSCMASIYEIMNNFIPDLVTAKYLQHQQHYSLPGNRFKSPLCQ